MLVICPQLQISFFASLTPRQNAEVTVRAYPQHVDVHSVLNRLVRSSLQPLNQSRG